MIITWLKERFNSFISFLFVFNVVCYAFLGIVVGGAVDHSFIGLILGILIGGSLGVVIFGFIATILSMSETQDRILKVLQSLQDTEKFSKNDLISNNQITKAPMSQTSQLYPRIGMKMVEKNLREGYFLSVEGSKVFAKKDTGDGTRYCPHCYCVADSKSDYCIYCRKSFVLDK